MSKRSAYILLTDMMEAIDAIKEYTAGLDYESFLKNRMARDAVVRNVQVLGEAANRVPKPFRDQHTTIEWMRIIRTRHILVHDYFGLDYEIMWRIITVHLPPLQQAINSILDSNPLEDADVDQI
ncbi:HepT-like ribonuclease domain-containing protein [Spirosoma lituiforme]